MTGVGIRYDPGSAAHRFAKSYALRCVRGTPSRLLVQPDLLEPQIVVLAVVVRLEIPDVKLP
jgi:hypothetical protein